MDYMKLAREAIDHVDRLNMRSNNRTMRLNGVDELHGTALGQTANMQFGAVFSELVDSDAKLLDDNMTSALLAPVLVGRNLRFANCEARAGEAFLYLARKGVRPLECMAVTHGESDHVILVLGRDQKTRIQDGQWNPDAVICDAWARSCYKAPLLAQQLARPEFRGVVDPAPYLFLQTYELLTGPWPPAALERVCRVHAI